MGEPEGFAYSPMLSLHMRNKLNTPLLVGGLSILVAIFPAIPTLVAVLIAKANNCTLHEGFRNPCLVLGVDIGQLLYPMGVSMWLVILSVPVGLLGLLVSVVWFVIAFFKKEVQDEK